MVTKIRKNRWGYIDVWSIGYSRYGFTQNTYAVIRKSTRYEAKISSTAPKKQTVKIA